MKTFTQSGNTLTLIAPTGGVVSGGVYLFEDLVVVAAVTADGGDPFAAEVIGVYEVPKTSAQAWAAGQAVYWDDTAGEFSTAGSTGQILCGCAAAAAANPSSTGLVRLDGVVRP